MTDWAKAQPDASMHAQPNNKASRKRFDVIVRSSSHDLIDGRPHPGDGMRKMWRPITLALTATRSRSPAQDADD
ncbi:MAG: hypothetical protein ACTHJP_00985 [Rhodanobacteraceae bacterium]